jgi:hypothetical protein
MLWEQKLVCPVHAQAGRAAGEATCLESVETVSDLLRGRALSVCMITEFFVHPYFRSTSLTRCTDIDSFTVNDNDFQIFLNRIVVPLITEIM